ncbi:MAG: YHS domain-containing protein [Planctomycetaceae bacterium]|nr:YHS domain-containing protein [Planctomycetaceae bacterium]
MESQHASGESWLSLARKLDWDFSYVDERDVFPAEICGKPWLDGNAWRSWDEPYKTSYSSYVATQHEKEQSLKTVDHVLGRLRDFQSLDVAWLNGLKLHAAALPLAEFAATIGNLRAARFGRDGAWRAAAALGALDECRHAQIPLRMMHKLVRWDRQFDWTHKFYHTNCWVAIAARRLFDELLLFSDPIEFAVATNFVFETGFTNLQFIGLASIAEESGDRLFEQMTMSIQTDEARHAQIGLPVLETVIKHDPEYAQYLIDKWFWRSWVVFAILTGFTMDYLTPVEKRKASFKEFVQEWVLDQFLTSIENLGLKKPWYWDTFLQSLDYYHHMVYASAYTYRATVWFDLVVPGPGELHWLAEKYPNSWKSFEPVWNRIHEQWEHCDPGVDFGVHGTSIVGFCNMCQIVLCQGTPEHNTACTLDHKGQRYIFCSEPCKWIFEREPDRYAGHKDLVKRVLAGEAPANLVQLLRTYCSLDFDSWGKDARKGEYPWLRRQPKDPRKEEG